MRNWIPIVCASALALSLALDAGAVIKLEDTVLALQFDQLDVSDVSPAMNHGELTEGADFGKGKYGQSSLKIKSPQHAVIPISDGLRLHNTDFTMAMWVSFSEPPPNAGLIGHDKGLGAEALKADWQYFGGRFQIQINRGGNKTAWARSQFWEDPPIDTWFHLAVTRSGEVYSFWVDGASIGDDEEDLKFPSDGHDEPIAIGATEGATYNTTGLIDEVVIARAAYGEDDLKRLMNGGIAGSVLAVESRGKVASTWAGIKNGE